MPGMIVGYRRSSMADQVAGYEAQKRDLEAAGCEKVFGEKVSSVADRPQMAAAMEFLREGDTLVVTKPDRLARSTMDLLKIIADLKARKIGLRVLSMGLDTQTDENPTTTLLLQLLGCIAEFERALMLERQKEGILKARQEGRFKGRPRQEALAPDVIKARLAAGETPTELAKSLGVARSSVYRAAAAAELLTAP